MKILVVTPYLPYPPDSGGRIRKWEVVRYLGQRHNVTLATFAQPGEERYRKALESCCRAVVMVGRTRAMSVPLDGPRLPLPVFGYFSPHMEAALRKLSAEQFDVAIFEHIFMAQYEHLFPMSTVVLNEHNIESTIYRQIAALNPAGARAVGAQGWVHKATALHLAAYEDRMWPRFPLRTTVSEDDRAEMQRRCAVGKTVVVENGIDLSSIRPLMPRPSRRLLFMGTLDYYPNIDAVFCLVEQIMPHVWAHDPEVSLVIAGRNPPREIIALRDRRVEIVAGPPDMSAVAADCALAVVPLRAGSGTRIKILHAMAMGLPVLSTRLGAEGLAVADGQELLLRDDPAEFAAAALQLLGDAELRARLRARGLTLVETRYDWPRVLERLETALTSL